MAIDHGALRIVALLLAFLLPLQSFAAQPSSAATVPEALEAGDLETARELATAERMKRPTDPDAWRVEAQVHEQRGDLRSAIEARKQQLALMPEDAKAERAGVRQHIETLETRARGTVADEPRSQHRAALDAKRSPPPPKVAAPPKMVGEPAAPPRDRIVKKWYFWVTMAAIAASAAAITGIAIKAATAEQSDSLDAQGVGGATSGGPILRF